MLNFQTACTLLGVKKESSTDEVKKRYRALITQWHPDRNKSVVATQKMQDINAAYACWQEHQKIKESNPAQLEQQSKTPPSYTNSTKNVEVDLNAFLSGFRVDVSQDEWTLCPRCMSCGCAECSQKGYISQRKTYHVELKPPFINQHVDIQVGPKPWRININVKKHPFFYIDAQNTLRANVCIDCIDAMLGANVQVPLPNGSTKSLYIPAGASSGQQLILPGEGLWLNETRRGPLIYILRLTAIAVEDSATIQQLRLLQKELRQNARVPDASYWRSLAHYK